MKKKVLLSSILTIAVCLSLIAGSTFALFTADDTVSITMKGAQVAMSATIVEDSLKLYSIGDYMGDGVTTFENGGYATVVDAQQQLTLTNVTPGDEVKFDIQMFNDSNVHILYRVQYTVVEPQPLPDQTPMIYAFGETIWQEWKIPTTVEEKYRTTEVDVYFDLRASNRYQNQDMAVYFVVEAYQANADVYDTLITSNDFAALQNAANKSGIVDGGSGNVIDGGATKSITIPTNPGYLEINPNTAVTLQRVTLNAGASCVAAVASSVNGELTLGTGAVINANNTTGVFYLQNKGDLILGEGSKINASGANGACIMMQTSSGEANVYFNGSDLLNPTNGAKGMYLICGFSTFNMYFETAADMAAYRAMIVEEDVYEGTNTYNFYINGTLVETTQNP